MIYVRPRGYSRAGAYGDDFDGYRMIASGLDLVLLEEKSREMLTAAKNIKGTDG